MDDRIFVNAPDSSVWHNEYLVFYKIVGWVARSKTQHQHTNTLEMLGFILQPNLPYLNPIKSGNIEIYDKLPTCILRTRLCSVKLRSNID